ncbi:type II toxin-antitoxin system VapC family toxin [Tsukamurella ocularis]|uniref:type II toxin-antitoxin system VapC family toxin n=1 Tax=Tsukamurella ocularis TaxID=1970234 RepID=UPI0021690C85|nr:type II toxin-antitoxin system VapC family toxin [Tsukamurella ocularis]MCS3779068.1 putative nucleic acid-binding protein [Tsukamurella ocularis]MCS3787312.1 putative nucleic acid-binding protein [Tsukamurella ocularis]MCS3851751.1 putative nucleic acid-binding protein [Tsukamurella ocularis]
MIYLDTSALTKMLNPENESDVLTAWMAAQADGGKELTTSVIGRIEIARVAARSSDPDDVPQAQFLGSRLVTVPLTTTIARAAESVGPAHLRSLDAIHLASAVSIRELVSAFVSYDKRLLAAARAEGLPVVSPGAE